MRHKQYIGFYLATAFYWFAMYTYVPILSPYVAYLGGSNFFIGIVIGSYGLSQMMLRIPLGIWSDKIGSRKPFILAGIALAALSSLGFALSANPWLALSFRAVAGAAAASWVAFTVLFASYFDPNEASSAMGVISLVTSLGQMLASTAGGFLAGRFGWHAPFFLGTAGGVLAFLSALRIRESRRPRQAVAIQSLISIGRERPLWTASILAVLAQSATFTTMYGFTPLHAAEIGATKAELGLLTLLTTLPNAIAGYLGGSVLTRRFGPRATVALGFAATAVFTALVPWTQSFAALLATQMVNGFAQGVLMPVLMGQAIQSVEESKRATAMGFFQAIYSIGMFGGPFLTGWLANAFGLRGGFVFVGLVCLLGTLFVTLWLPRRGVTGFGLHSNAVSPAGDDTRCT